MTSLLDNMGVLDGDGLHIEAYASDLFLVIQAESREQEDPEDDDHAPYLCEAHNNKAPHLLRHISCTKHCNCFLQ